MFLSKNKKSGIYYVWFSENGKRNKISTKSRDYNEADRFMKNYEKNKKNDKIDDEYNGIFTIKKLIEWFNNFISLNYASGTVLLYQATFKFILDIIGNKPVVDLTSDDIENYKKNRLKVAKKVTVNIELRNIRAMLNKSLDEKKIDSIPFKISFFSVDESERRCFSDYDINNVLSKVDNSYRKKIYLFALHTGMRLGEICSLQYRDIDIEQKLVFVRNKDNHRIKTGKQRAIPINEYVLSLLEYSKYKDSPNKYVFGKDNKDIPFQFNYVSRKFKEYLMMCGLTTYNFHCLRHTFITNLIKLGTPINYVQELAGHSDISTTMKYIHISTDDLRKSVNKLNYGIAV